METGQPIEIPLSKSKLILMLAGALAFVAMGIWFIIAPPQIDNAFWGDPTKIAITGYAAILFFGLCTVVLIRKLPDTRPGLIIDATGLTDNSGALSAGHILWTDIENISVLEIQKQKLLMLEVRNPQDYINRQKSMFKRKGMALNYKMYGTPLCIATNALRMPFQELLTLVTHKFLETKTDTEQPLAFLQATE